MLQQIVRVRRSGASSPRYLVIAASVAVLAIVVAVFSGVRASAADTRAAVLAHKLADANTLVEQYSNEDDSTQDDNRLIAAKDAVIRARLSAVGADATMASVVTPGVHLAGVDVAPGVYEAGAPTSLCKYGWFVGSGYQDVDAGGGGQPVFVTLAEGNLFHSAGCGDWRSVDG